MDEKRQEGRGGAGDCTVGEREVERIAARVVELLRHERGAREDLIDAAEVARRLGLSRGTVYDRADELGAVRLGEGPRARLRFDPSRLADRLEGSESGRHAAANRAPARRQVRGRPPRSVEMLPVRGSASE